MASPEYSDRQKFKSKDGTSLASVLSHLCTATDKRYLLWTDIQRTYQGIDHLETEGEKRILFTIDANGELWQPLRIQHDPDNTLIVIYSNNRRQQAEKSFNILQDSVDHAQGDCQNRAHDEIRPSLEDLFDTCKHLYRHLNATADNRIDDFRQAAANVRYFHSMFVEDAERFGKARVNTLVDGKDQKKMLKVLCDLEQQVPELTYRNTCRSMLYEVICTWDISRSSLFIVLPSDLNTWDSVDATTCQFRLYFLCDNWKRNSAPEDMPQHVHLSNHPGYRLRQPEEFFRLFGDYVLRMLRMVKHGYSDSVYEIPPLDTFKILWDFDSDTVGNKLSKDTLESLIDRAIAYLQELSSPKWTTKIILDRDQCDAIRSYLEIQHGDNAEGNLHRFISSDRQVVSWMCPSHTHQYLDHECLGKLRTFVYAHRGHIDMQQARIGVELGSIVEADLFRTLLLGTKHTFNISIRLGWNATRSCVKTLCVDIAKTGTVVLELDGISLDLHPQDHERHWSNLFSDAILKHTELQHITILNYPRPHEHCVHFDLFSLQTTLPPARFLHRWIELRSDLETFVQSVSDSLTVTDINKAVSALHSVLEKHGLSEVTEVTIYNHRWDVIFDLKEDAIAAVYLFHYICPKGVLSSGTLRQVTVHLDAMEFDHEFFDMVKANTDLQELTVSYCGHNVLRCAEHFVRAWHASACSFRLTLLDRMEDTQGRVAAELSIGQGEGRHSGHNSLDDTKHGISPQLYSQRVTNLPKDIEFLQWDSDHVFSQLDDFSASFLDMATRQHPSVLTMFTLDVSRLSCVGLSSIQDVFRRPNLEHLHIMCTSFDSRMSDSISQVLGSVQWSSLKSLAFSGNNIDAWLKTWPSPTAPQLLRLAIRGTGSVQQALSHSSVLFIHQLVYASPLDEIHFVNTYLQDERDWTLIIDGVDFSTLTTFGLDDYGSMQLLSVPDAVDIFGSKLEETYLDAGGPKLNIPMFTLDITTLSHPSLALAQLILSHCCVSGLIVKCAPFDFSLSDSIAQVLYRLRWSTLEFLQLSGDNINGWIQLLAGIDAPRLKDLEIWGTESVPQELNHSSVLFIEEIVCNSSLEELDFVHIQLQDKSDWVRLVECLDPSMLENFKLGGRSYYQFMDTPEAVDLERSKRIQWKAKNTWSVLEA